jgi:hypothetical protein
MKTTPAKSDARSTAQEKSAEDSTRKLENGFGDCTEALRLLSANQVTNF